MDYPKEYKKKKIVFFYSYKDELRNELFVVARTEDKEFPIFHKNEYRHWVFKAPAVNVPYRLPDWNEADKEELLFIVEGEKDVETLFKHGFFATTCRGGANASNAFKQWLPLFKDRHIIILPDNDEAGYKHGERVLEILQPVAASIQIVKLPGLPEKGDVTDWFELSLAGKDDFELLIDTLTNGSKPTELVELPGLNGSAQHGDAWEDPADALGEEEVEQPGWKPFPIDSIPIEIAEFVLESARVLSCDPGYTVLPCLVTTGGAIGNSRICKLTEEWTEPAVFWGALVAEPSTMKTPAASKAKEPIEVLEDEFNERYESELETYESAFEGWKMSRGKFDLDDQDEPRAAPKLPIQRRVRVDDITVEKLAEVLHDNPKGVILFRDELSGWFGSFTRYKSGGSGGTDLPFWLEVFRAGEKHIDRKGGNKPSMRVKRPAVSVYGSIQPETVVETFNRSFFTSGFAARMLFSMPPRSKKAFVEQPIPFPVREAYRHTFRQLYFMDGEKAYDRRHPPSFVSFSPAGMEAWRAFYKEWGDRQHLSLGEIGSALAKLEAYCARFAMLFALTDYVNGRTPQEQIEETHVKNAFAVVSWFAGEANRVYAMIQAPLAKIELERLIQHVARHEGQMTPRRLVQSNQSKYEDCQVAKAALQGLVDKGLGFWERTTPGALGGRPSEVFRLLTQRN